MWIPLTAATLLAATQGPATKIAVTTISVPFPWWTSLPCTKWCSCPLWEWCGTQGFLSQMGLWPDTVGALLVFLTRGYHAEWDAQMAQDHTATSQVLDTGYWKVRNNSRMHQQPVLKPASQCASTLHTGTVTEYEQPGFWHGRTFQILGSNFTLKNLFLSAQERAMDPVEDIL